MRRTAWLRSDWGSKIKLGDISRGRLLANRIVLCADCDTNRALMVSPSARLICSSCGSENWMFVSAPILARLREYDEQKTLQHTAIAP
jgi:ribosomal protein S27E